ncbi:MAG TPA: hypothetical protein VMU19_12365 [Bryobacteraceae bacterium]|nr:hypothetical protein [Bryobacteraceae bacterium]
MKGLCVFLLVAAGAAAQTFANGQAARLVIGQSTFTDQNPNSSDTVLGAASGIAYAADTLFVADSNRMQATPSNNRVVLYQNLSSQLPLPTDELSYTTNCPVCVGKATVVLGQPNFTASNLNYGSTSNDLRTPTAIASDGVHLVVADTDHNRVLIWNHIPATNNTPADVVIGQPNFTADIVPANNVPSASSLLGPQGVWIQNGKLWVADTQNNRVLGWNQIPTKNGQAADIVLGQPNFTTYVQIDITQQTYSATAQNMLNPVAVTSDGQRLFVADLANNRVLIWNAIPTANDAPADVALGQPSLNTSLPNNAYSVDLTSSACEATPIQPACMEVPVLCPTADGVDVNNNPVYPNVCNATLNFPRFVLAAGNRLFVADGGNDRVLVYEHIPTSSGAMADEVLGQIGQVLEVGPGEVGPQTVNQATTAADSMTCPTSLAWDGANLYVADPFNRRITVYTIEPNALPYQGVRNGASYTINASGWVAFTGAIRAADTVTLTISLDNAGTTTTNTYTYTIQSNDTLDSVINNFMAQINNANNGAGDAFVTAAPDYVDLYLLLYARSPGPNGNDVAYSVTTSSAALIAAQTESTYLQYGGDASQIAPGTLVSIFPNPGMSLSYATASADTSQSQLPTQMAGVEVYLNGIRAPLLYVSPTQINAQVPWELSDTTSVNVYVRTVASDGTVTVTAPVAMTVVPAAPGIFTYLNGANPAQAIMLHGSDYATGVVSVDGGANAGDYGTITINGRNYSYTVQSTDTLATVRDAFVSLINASDPEVTAIATKEFTRIILQAKVQGPDGEGISYGVNTLPAPTVTGGELVLTAFTNNLCCSNIAGTFVTQANPAQGGEFVLIYATGIGLPIVSPATASVFQTGVKFPAGTPITAPAQAVAAATQGLTAQVLQVSAIPGTFGLYQVLMQLQTDLNTNPASRLTINQNALLSNLTVFPVVNPLQALVQPSAEKKPSPGQRSGK